MSTSSTSTAADDLMTWSARLAPWRQDALRRLACGPLSAADHEEILAAIKEKAGLPVAVKPPAPIPLTRQHLAAAADGPQVALTTLRKVRNVNRLLPDAELTFGKTGLTVIYGRNGSGKSGFVRILRTACRTRVDNLAKLKVLSDVYGAPAGSQTAEIVITDGQAEEVIQWTSDSAASDRLTQIAVFDTSAAQLYVDGGNQIQFLPFGLALPHRLNELCLILQAKVDTERAPITEKIALAGVAFKESRSTLAQTFYAKLTAESANTAIDAAATFMGADEARLTAVTQQLGSSQHSVVDLEGLATWCDSLSTEVTSLAGYLSEVAIKGFVDAKRLAESTRLVAGVDAKEFFKDEPLPGVGGDTWRELWLAAKAYSLSEAYPGRRFPVVDAGDDPARCVLCQQPLEDEAAGRLRQFDAFISGMLAQAASNAEDAVASALKALPTPKVLRALDWNSRVLQIRRRSADLADALVSLRTNLEGRLSHASAVLRGVEHGILAPLLELPTEALVAISASLRQEAEHVKSAADAEQRAALVSEQSELEDRQVLAANVETLKRRRDLLKQLKLYDAVRSEIQTTGITQKANQLVDTHLTQAVLDTFEMERGALAIAHIRVGLARKSSKTKAEFQTTPGTTQTKFVSDILSEGEQRALALAAFLTEATVSAGCGPIIVDDPVSSLDRERGVRVAQRLVTEGKQRQVIVFTHDLVFYNDLCNIADKDGVPILTHSIFSDADNSGRVDPAGVTWRGLSTAKRLVPIKSDFVRVAKLHSSSPSDYERALKGLYGRLRDCYERMLEEHVFCDVVRRGVERIETLKLRMVHLPDDLAVRFHTGMTKANTYSHDNALAGSVQPPSPEDFQGDLAFFDALLKDLAAAAKETESRRPSMMPKKD